MTWIPVKERLPKTHDVLGSRGSDNVLITNGLVVFVGFYLIYTGHNKEWISPVWYTVGSSSISFVPTHWLPFPKFPKEKNK
jgi:hypothetical protein